MPELSISRIISWRADIDPDRPAITYENQTITRREFDLHTNRLARAYAELGVKQDDFVTVALPNGIEFYAACIAIWKLGATPQPISARLPQIEREAIVELADPTLVVGAEPGSLGDRTVLPIGFEPDAALSDAPLEDRTATYWKAMTSGGSTGRPKLIVSKDNGQFDTDTPFAQQQPDRAQLVPGPLYHNGPFIFSMHGLFQGNHIVVMTRFDAEKTLQFIEQYNIDWVMFVPTMMQRIWRLDEAVRNRYDLSSLRIMLHLAAPCPPWLKEVWIEWLGGERVHELYGGTEGTGSTWITGDEWLAHRGSVGKFINGKVKIIGENGEELPPGEIGEVFLLPDQGAGQTYKYIGAEAKKTDDGWESLGDMGWLDEDGYLYLGDRRNDMVISGGANIYPAEVEAAIDAHLAVRSSAVIGLPHEDLGQSIHAIVDATEPVTEDDLIAHLSERLVRYKIPRSFEFVDEPLRDDAGKVRRSALREMRVKET